MLEIGEVVDGKYKILNKIGQGGMSVVYLAMNERANKQWAIKEVRKDGVSNFEVVKQGLIAETDLLKKLNHPNLPSIIDVIDGEGTFLIVMDYIEGNSLSKALKDYGALPQEDVIEWAKQLCDVLGYLHSRQPAIIYRDMKPSNVMLKPDGTVTLIDFGTAREFKSHNVADTTCLGTQGYAAPEQFGGQGQTDARTDIYCLGATLYHLVTGHNPCDPPYEMYPIRQWNPALSSGLEEIILKCTQKNPADRYQSCAELMYALEHYTELDEGFRKKQKRKWRLFLASSITAVVSIIAAIGFKVSENIVVGNSYDTYVSQAANITDFANVDNFTQAYDYYKKAIAIDPGREEAYEGLLKAVIGDNIFDENENSLMLDDLHLNENLEKLKSSNEDAYGRVAYELAKDYFFYYDVNTENNTIGSKSASKSVAWYDAAEKYFVAKESNQNDANSTERIRKRSENMKTLADLVTKANSGILGKGDITGDGDTNGSYAEYYNKLDEIVNDETETNPAVIVRSCQLMVNSLIYAKIDELKNSGIDATKINSTMTRVQERLSGISNSDWQNAKNQIIDHIVEAKELVNQVYGTEQSNTEQ